jgi:hypothetical protein
MKKNIFNYPRLDQSEINISKNWITGNYQDVVFISLGDRPELQDVVEPAKICLKAAGILLRYQEVEHNISK